MSPAKFIKLGEKVANLHRCRIKDTPGSGSPPALCSGQATVKRLADHVGDRCTALSCDRANPLVTLIVNENLKPMRQHTHTLACAYGISGDGPAPVRRASFNTARFSTARFSAALRPC